MAKKYYQILNLEESATSEDIKKAYRKLASRWHPDKWANKTVDEKSEATKKMQEVNQAYEILGDEERRRRYDNGVSEKNFTSSQHRSDETVEEFLASLGSRVSEECKESIRRAYSFMSENDKANIRRDYDELNRSVRETELLREQEKIIIKLLKLYGKYLCRTDAYHEINYELVMNNIYSSDLDSNLWAPYETFLEKIFSIEIGDDENDLDFIDRRNVLAFKENMFKAIRKKGIEVKQRKEEIEKGINVPAVDKSRRRAIERIEEELKASGLKPEDLGEYSNYKEQINSLPKVWKIRSFEDEVVEYIESKSLQQQEKSRREDGNSWKNERGFYSNGKLNWGNQFAEESHGKHSDWTKEQLIKRIEELEEVIEELEEDDSTINDKDKKLELILKKKKELKQLKKHLSSSQNLKKELTSNNNNFFSDPKKTIGLITIIMIGLIISFNFIRKRKKV